MRFLVWVDYCNSGKTKRTPYRDQHRDYNHHLKEDGILVMAGSTQDYSYSLRIYEAKNQNDVESLIVKDPYWRQGIWTAMKIDPFIQVI